MSIINVECVDQTLKITNSPLIASGGVEENRVEFSFDSSWNEFGKTAIFFNDHNTVYYTVLDVDDGCTVPHEVTDKAGKMFFGVFGVSGENDEIRRTTEILQYNVVEGAITEGIIEPAEPSPEVYEQIMSAVAQAIAAVQGKQDALTFDNVPTTGSTNVVTSGGIKNAIESAIDDITAESINAAPLSHVSDTSLHTNLTEKTSWNSAPRYLEQGTELDGITTTGLYYVTANTSGAPTNGGFMLTVLMANGRGTQIATVNGASSNMWIRSMMTGTGGGWQTWRRIVTADMFSLSGTTLTITTT